LLVTFLTTSGGRELERSSVGRWNETLADVTARDIGRVTIAEALELSADMVKVKLRQKARGGISITATS